MKPVVFTGIPPVGMPGAVMAALDYLRFADAVRSPRSMFENGPANERDLSGREQAVYDAALDLLRDYFRGRLVFPDAAQPQPPGGEGPEQPQPAPF